MGGEERRPLRERRLSLRQEAAARDRPTVRFLTKRLDIAEVVDPALHHGNDQVFFGATVRFASDHGEERTIRILGVDEAESARGEVSWVAPIARALLKARVGDEVRLVTPRGVETIEVLEVSYPPPGGDADALRA